MIEWSALKLLIKHDNNELNFVSMGAKLIFII
jgi:hypothetical protein